MKWGEIYAAQRQWADRYVPRQLALLADAFATTAADIRISTPDEDIVFGVDAYVLSEDVTVGLRVRTPGKPKDEYTIRLHRNRHGLNEIDKIRNGRINYMMYSHAANVTDDELELTYLINLDSARRAMANWWDGVRNTIRFHPERGDFMAVNIDDLTAKYGLTVAAAYHTTSNADGSTTTLKLVQPAFENQHRKAG